jgi:hypothetical protein
VAVGTGCLKGKDVCRRCLRLVGVHVCMWSLEIALAAAHCKLSCCMVGLLLAMRPWKAVTACNGVADYNDTMRKGTASCAAVHLLMQSVIVSGLAASPATATDWNVSHSCAEMYCVAHASRSCLIATGQRSL